MRDIRRSLASVGLALVSAIGESLPAWSPWREALGTQPARPVPRESATMAQRDMDEGGRKIDMEQICVEAARPGRRESLG